MIKTAIQLKAKIRNISGSDNKVAMTMIRVFFMERFLERVSISAYKNQFVLKGGMLVSSLIGLNSRATMDIDATVQALPLTQEEIEKIVNEIGGIPLEDNVSFEIKSIETIMDEFDYPGVRVHMEGKLDNLKQPIKIDISTDDVITPRAVEYGYQLMFEDRDIELQSYNIETLLAEKLQTILSRGLANTRARDFYDVYEITHKKFFERETLKTAFLATCEKRDTVFTSEQMQTVLEDIGSDMDMRERWNQFKKNNYYVEDLSFDEVMDSVQNLVVSFL